jgi:hypothetical protein
MMALPMMFFLQKHLLENHVPRECDCSDAEARKRASKPLEACEHACVPPLFTMKSSVSRSTYICSASDETYYRAQGSPFAALLDAAAASFLGSKPVREGRGAMSILCEIGQQSMS